MANDLNYAIILFGDTKIEGWTDWWECHSSSSVDIYIDGIRYKTGIDNVLLMHKEED